MPKYEILNPKQIQMHKFQISKRKSFTLLEILTVVFLGSIIIMTAYSVYLMSYKSYKKQSASAELTQNARIALERMSRDIRQTLEIVGDLPADATAPVSEITFQDGHNFWIATSPAPSPSPTASPNTGKIQYITYRLQGTDLHREVFHYAFDDHPDDWVLYSTLDSDGIGPTPHTDEDRIKAQQISSLQFWGEDTITINLAVSDGTTTYPFQTKVLGRNIQ